MKDIAIGRNHPADRVLLFQDGPLVELLRSQGVATAVCLLSERGAAVRKGSGPLRKLTSLADVWRLAREVAAAARDADVIYANTAKALVVSALAGRLAHKPVIYHLHDILSPDHFSWSNRKLLLFLAKRCVTHTIANSHASAQCLIDAGVDPATISVIYNGISPEPFEQAIADSDRLRGEIRRALGIPHTTPVLGLFGRFAAWKGQHVAIEALRQLPGVQLMLVGDALFGEADYVRRLKELADQPELRGRVHFLGFRDDVPALMRAADIILHCSTAPEPFGRVIVEAMLAERPIIASRAGGAIEIVRDEVTGLLVEPGSADALAAAVNRLLSGEIDRPAMVAAAAKDARERFDPKKIVGEIEARCAGVASCETREARSGR